QKPESQDICFVREGGYRRLLADRGVEAIPGDIVDTSGNVLGRHTGISNYTIGQRRGLGVAAGHPLFVVSLDAAKNRVVVGDKKDLLSRGLVAREPNILFDPLPKKLTASIRYAHSPRPCGVTLPQGRLEVVFDEPQEAVTPGQSVVLYHDDCVVGGGTIESAFG
ncbi:MAG: tRNA 2-thiouridine(34) synthase MnmA, partial [Chitinivibrionales bacterium]|nr:tRNA 2-thiouridine(34) synthase MnmA [Chitinivibrionales bacterium]